MSVRSGWRADNPFPSISLDFQSMNNQEEQEDPRNCLFFGMCKCPETPRRSDGSMKRQYSDMGENYHRLIEEEDELEGQSIDTKLLMVLEYLRELYVTKVEVLKTMFPGAKEGFRGFFKKVGEAMPHAKSHDDLMVLRTLSRTRSLGPDSPTRMERFKVTTVNAGPPSGGPTSGGATGDGAAGQGGTKK